MLYVLVETIDNVIITEGKGGSRTRGKEKDKQSEH